MDARIAPPFMEATDASRLVCVVVVSYQEYSLTLTLAGGDWLSPPATDPCLLPVTSASETRARCRQRGVCRAAQPPRRKFWPEEVWRPSFVTRGAKLRVWRQRLTPLTRPRRSDWEGSCELKSRAFGRSWSRPADPGSGKKFYFAGSPRVGGAPKP